MVLCRCFFRRDISVLFLLKHFGPKIFIKTRLNSVNEPVFSDILTEMTNFFSQKVRSMTEEKQAV